MNAIWGEQQRQKLDWGLKKHGKCLEFPLGRKEWDLI